MEILLKHKIELIYIIGGTVYIKFKRPKQLPLDTIIKFLIADTYTWIPSYDLHVG